MKNKKMTESNKRICIFFYAIYMRYISLLIGSLTLAVIFGYTVGRIIDIKIAYSTSEISLIPDIRPTIPVINIEGIYNGMLEGTVNSGARLFIGGEYVLPNSSGSFTIPAGPFLVNNINITIPEGMNYVASKRGKKYYNVTSASAQNLSPANRIYFKSEKEAKAEGYVQ